MSPENIKQLQIDLDAYKKAAEKVDKMNSVIKHIGVTGLNNTIGTYVNEYQISIQAAIQYEENDKVLYSSESLNEEFIETLKLKFNSLMEQTIYRINLEYRQAKSALDKYSVRDKI